MQTEVTGRTGWNQVNPMTNGIWDGRKEEEEKGEKGGGEEEEEEEEEEK